MRRQDDERESSKSLRTELCGWREGGMTKHSSVGTIWTLESRSLEPKI